ncbi:MAG: multicopper oxidase domain-containing protein [Verrucomicrobiales bacterium]|nr:multicopper oxidase domain-containing protein [Verrucomicrobiales bacterium]
MRNAGGTYFGQAPEAAHTRRYFIAVEQELWDFAPEGRDVVCGRPLPPEVVQQRQSAKLRYVQYTDASFAARVLSEPRLGILGPVLRGVVGEYLAVTLLNRSPQPVSMHPHGVRYDKDSEGAYYEPGPGRGAAVAPGARFTYVWKLDESSGPQPNEPSSKAWLYHSHVQRDDESLLGLVGFIIVTDPNRARPDGTPADVDREMAALFMSFKPSDIESEEKEAAERQSPRDGGQLGKVLTELQKLSEDGELPAINGRLFGNLRLEMNEGERVRWYLFGLGSEEDFHTAHWHGLKVIEENQRRTDVIELLPASMKTADLVADNPGAWLFHCHVAEHMMRGMFALAVVHPNGARGASRPERAFFGLPDAQTSLRLDEAEAMLGPDGNCRIRLRGTVTVYQPFSVFAEPVTLRALNRSVTFKLNSRGHARMPNAEFETRNSDADRAVFGIMHGGELEFEINLHGPEWREALDRLSASTSVTNGGAPRIAVPISLEIGQASHRGTAEMSCVLYRTANSQPK